MYFKGWFWLLFILFINNLPNCSKTNFVIFVDDTTSFKKDSSLDTLNTNRASIIGDELTHGWFNANRLCLNIEKQ